MPDNFLLHILMTCCLLCVPLTAPVQATPLTTQEQQVEKIQNLYRNLTSLSFDFIQRTRASGRQRNGAGNAVFYRPAGAPGVMRWNYTAPDKQTLLCDGKKFSIYSEKDHQVIVSSADVLQSDITYAFFTGSRNVLADFKALPASTRFALPDNSDLQALQLVPKKPQSQLKALHLFFDTDLLLKKILIEDHFDSITELVFTHIKQNTLAADSTETLAKLTRLDLPEGTEVISQ